MQALRGRGGRQMGGDHVTLLRTPAPATPVHDRGINPCPCAGRPGRRSCGTTHTARPTLTDTHTQPDPHAHSQTQTHTRARTHRVPAELGPVPDQTAWHGCPRKKFTAADRERTPAARPPNASPARIFRNCFFFLLFFLFLGVRRWAKHSRRLREIFLGRAHRCRATPSEGWSTCSL